MRSELENDSDDDEQYDDSLQQFMRTETEGFREEFRDVQDEDSEFDFLNVNGPAISSRCAATPPS